MLRPMKLPKAVGLVTLLLLGCPPAAKDAKSAKDSASKQKAAGESKEKQPPPFQSGGW